MTPDEALEEQVRRYRQMTGEERLQIALRLHELSCDVAREGIRQQNPHANEDEVLSLNQACSKMRRFPYVPGSSRNVIPPSADEEGQVVAIIDQLALEAQPGLPLGNQAHPLQEIRPTSRDARSALF